MKRILKNMILVILAVATVTCLAACGQTRECDWCGEVKPCTSYSFLGEQVYVCSSCKKELQQMSNELWD